MKGTLVAFLAIALFSLYAVFGKLLLGEVSPFVILVLNQALAGVILILILDFIKKIREIRRTSKHDVKFLYLISLFSSVGGPLLFLLGLKLTTATNSILIGKSEAVLTSLLAIWILKDRVTKHQIIGAIIMFLGVFVIATKNFSIGLSFNIGDIFIFLSAISYAIGTIFFKKYMHHIPTEVIVTLRNLFGASTLFVISLFFVDFTAVYQALTIKFVIVLLLLVVFTTICGQYLWYKALEMTSATKVSLAGLSSPMIAVFYAFIFLKERLIPSQITGGILIMIGLVVLEWHFKDIHTPKRHERHVKLKHLPHA